MCGIVGYVGERMAADILVAGLRRLEYRGYDSAGVAIVGAHGLERSRSVGKIATLDALLRAHPLAGTIGLGHTRWATHGPPAEHNAHPHVDCSGTVAVVHNGILENHRSLRQRLTADGHRFTSQTDTEVLAHLIEHHLRDDPRLERAVQRALTEVTGSFAIAALWAGTPDRLVAAKQGAGGVVVGLGAGEMFIASDLPAVLAETRDVVILEDGEVAVVTQDAVAVTTFDGVPIERHPTRIQWDPVAAEKGGYPHYMLKEIHEQPRAVTDTVRGLVDLESGSVTLADGALDPATLGRIQRVILVACGTSYYAGLVGRVMLERLSGLLAEVDLASEFRYRQAPVGPETLIVALSQSGETADTLGAAKVARAKGSPVLAITNVVGSALAREADAVLYTRAGPEIGVAASKTFTATVTACYLLALYLGRERGALTARDTRKRIQELLELPALMEAALGLDAQVAEVARDLATHGSILFLGRGIQYPVALEGALKVKELAYVHAEGYAAGEMKHGPIALIDDTMPVVVVAPRDQTYDRMLANIEEVRARGGEVIAITHAQDAELAALAYYTLPVPATDDLLAPILTVLPLQLLAYHVAVLRGSDVDQPRNLAKSVTVE